MSARLYSQKPCQAYFVLWAYSIEMMTGPGSDDSCYCKEKSIMSVPNLFLVFFQQCCGSETFCYESGSGSGSDFSKSYGSGFGSGPKYLLNGKNYEINSFFDGFYAFFHPVLDSDPNPDPKPRVPDPDPTKSTGSMRIQIRIHNTVFQSMLYASETIL
jgi:hypothetical protein